MVPVIFEEFKEYDMIFGVNHAYESQKVKIVLENLRKHDLT